MTIMRYVDIHCHILPELDDGSYHIGDSLQMADMAVSDNTVGIVCTPHHIPGCLYTYADMKAVFQRTTATLRDKNIPLTLYPGQEIFLSDSISAIIRDLEAGQMFTLNHSAYPLVEFDPFEKEESVIRKLSRLISHGFVPIVAHPERYAFMNEDPDIAWELHDLGALLQVNKGSLKGFFGPEAAETSYFLLENRLADFVASDAHSPHVRTPQLHEAHEWISENFSYRYADYLLMENPELVLKNKKIYPYVSSRGY